MTVALGLGLLAIASLALWGAVANISPVGLLRALITGADTADVDAINPPS